MNFFWIVIGFLLYYIIKGVVWLIIDCLWLKTKYNDRTQTILNIVLWPIYSIKRTITQIKSWVIYIKKWKNQKIN